MAFDYKKYSKSGMAKVVESTRVAGLDDASRPVPTERFMPTVLDGEVVAYDIPKDSVFLLNEQASVVFALCDGERTVDRIVDDVAIAYSTTVAEVYDDVLDAISNFVEHKMLALESK
jgi:hypothetical protein